MPDKFDLEKQVPYSAEAEQSVLGAILVDPELISKAVLAVKPDNFYIKKHREIFEAMVDLHNLQLPIEAVLLLEKLRENGSFDGDQDKQYLLSLAESTSMINDIGYYLKIVADKAALRDMIDICQNVTEMCCSNEEVATVIDAAEQKIYDITNNRKRTDLYKLADVVYSELEHWSEMAADTTGKFEPMKLGMSALDNSIGGVNNSDLILLAARPGVGKTSFALNIAYNVARSSVYDPKKAVVVFSLEMSKEQLARRVLSSALRIPSDVLRSGKLSNEQWGDMYNLWKNELQTTPMYFDDTPNITTVEMKAKLRRVQNLGMIVVDYLQLMNSSKKIDNRVLEIGEITRSFKIMAKEFNVPILLLSQLSRGIEQRKEDDKTPRMSDLRDSGAIEQDADMILFLSRPDPKDGVPANTCDVIVGKNRHGQANQTIKLHWDGQFTSFNSMSTVPDDV